MQLLEKLVTQSDGRFTWMLLFGDDDDDEWLYAVKG